VELFEGNIDFAIPSNEIGFTPIIPPFVSPFKTNKEYFKEFLEEKDYKRVTIT
jgi:hypothetical protein